MCSSRKRSISPPRGVASPEGHELGLVQSPQQLVRAARRPARGGAGQPDEVDGEVAVVGAAALVGPIDELHQAIGDLAAAAAPRVVLLLREQPHAAPGVAHALRERRLGGRVALRVDDDDLPVARRRDAVCEAAEGDGLAGAGGADHQQRPAKARERHQHPAAPDLQELVAGDVAAKLERALARRARGDSGGAAGFALGALAGALGAALVALVQLLDRPPAKRRDRQRDREAQRRREQPPRPDVRPRRMQRLAGMHEHPMAPAGALCAMHLQPDPRPTKPHPPRARDSERGEGERRLPRDPRERDPAEQRGRADEQADRDREQPEIGRGVGFVRPACRCCGIHDSSLGSSRTWTRPRPTSAASCVRVRCGAAAAKYVTDP
jgi:hypothetical protein